MADRTDERYKAELFFAAELPKIPKDLALPKTQKERRGLIIGRGCEEYVKHCYVFGYQKEEDFFLKIGEAMCVRGRFLDIGSHNPKLRYFYSSPFLSEDIVQALFKEKRLMSEWYVFDAESEALLKQMFDNHDYRFEHDEILKKFDELVLGGTKWIKVLKGVAEELKHAKANLQLGKQSKLESQLKDMHRDLNDCYPYSPLNKNWKYSY